MRTATSPLLATLQLAVVGLGVPIALSLRLKQILFPLQIQDALLAAAIIVWLMLAKAVISRCDAMDSARLSHLSPMWLAHRLVDQSMLGAGWFATNVDPVGLDLVAAAHVPTSDQFPPMLHEVPAADKLPPLIPALDEPPKQTQLINETEEYVVARGDTFWSIAEAILDDGRLWTTLHHLNFGREVAPGVLLDDGDELRIGWSILIPRPTKDHTPDPHDS